VRAKRLEKDGSVASMTIRATLLALVVGLSAGASGCGHTQNKVLADTPVLPYQSPDIAEITGIDEDEEPAEETEEAPEPAPAPAPTPAAAPAPQAATPAPAPAPAPKSPAPAKPPAKK
jgi:hypothetical protein